MVVEEIRAYLSYLATDRKIAASTQNIALSALLFLCNISTHWSSINFSFQMLIFKLWLPICHSS
jgi:hypothetical protein